MSHLKIYYILMETVRQKKCSAMTRQQASTGRVRRWLRINFQRNNNER